MTFYFSIPCHVKSSSWWNKMSFIIFMLGPCPLCDVDNPSAKLSEVVKAEDLFSSLVPLFFNCFVEAFKNLTSKTGCVGSRGIGRSVGQTDWKPILNSVLSAACCQPFQNFSFPEIISRKLQIHFKDNYSILFSFLLFMLDNTPYKYIKLD